MSMRKYKRAVARHNMEKQGITNLNRKQYGPKGRILPSKFAANWRKYINK